MDEIISYENISFENVINDVDVVLDTIGGDVLMKSFLVTKKEGTVVSIVDFNTIKEADKFGVREKTVVAPNTTQLSAIAQLMIDGKIKPQIEKILPFSEVKKAHALVQSGHVRGKIMLKSFVNSSENLT